MNDPTFIHLRTHTDYSLVDGIVRVKKLSPQVANLGMPAVALTDHSNLFALVKFYRSAQASGIKPIVGADVLIEDESGNQPYFKLVLLARNLVGYRQLTRLITRAYLEGNAKGTPLLKRDWFVGETSDLIALSAAMDGDVGHELLAGNLKQAQQRASQWQSLFGENYFIELQRLGKPDEDTYVDAALELAAHQGIPVVATNDVRFLTKEEFEVHEARVCIHQGRTLHDSRRPRLYTPEQYLKSAEEMAILFHDLPEALANSVEIAKRCNVTLTLGEYSLPDFSVPEGQTQDQFFIAESEKGLEKRLEKLFEPATPDRETICAQYRERLKIELDVIIQMGFPGYFLIVADFIQWAKEHQIPVGPGRGSGAGSLVAYALLITDLDPIEYELLFERFLNPERVSMPDFDIDFCMNRRDEVIDYVAQRYGKDRVSQIITYGTMAAKAVVRDVGRILNHPYGYMDKLAKLVPFDVGMTLTRALKESEELRVRYENETDVAEIIDLALSLEGLCRNAGKHAGGVVIGASTLTDYSPLYLEPGAPQAVTQFDKDDVEAVGLVKFDFLGLRTLTIIDWAVRTINQQAEQTGQPPLDISTIPLDDRATFKLLKAYRTTAVFQLESRGMKDLIKRLEPDSFEEIIALVALFRPGPLQSGMVDDFINRKHGRAEIEYPHPSLEPILEPTYGIILYQEQVMQIAQVLAKFSLGGADLLRRAMGKKKAEEMAKQREIFLKGSVENGVDEAVANGIFDLMEKFAGYGFNKSHSAAYALLSYQTAWLKTHHASAFMAAVLSSDMDKTDKVVNFAEDCWSSGMTIEKPCVNQSQIKFIAIDKKTIRYGLGAIKGAGEAALANIIADRENQGPYRDIGDFCRRIDLRKANKRVLDALVKAGALDELGGNRATITAQLPEAIRAADQLNKAKSVGQNDLFSSSLGGGSSGATYSPRAVTELPEWEEDQRLKGEKETLGLYLTGHPIQQHLEETSHYITCRLNAVAGMTSARTSNKKQPATLTGMVSGFRRIIGKKGTFIVLELDDQTAMLEMTLSQEKADEYQTLLGMDQIVVIDTLISHDHYRDSARVQVETVKTIEEARSRYVRGIQLDLRQLQPGNKAEQLKALLEPFRGGSCQLRAKCYTDCASTTLTFGESWYLKPADELLKKAKVLLGDNGITWVYR